MKTADGSPRRRAIVSISLVVLRTVPPTWSTRTRTSLMGSLPQTLETAGSDELLRREEVDQRRGAAAVLVGHDLARAARGPLVRALDGRPGGRQPDLLGLDAEVAQRPGLDRLLLGRHDPLEGRVAR